MIQNITKPTLVLDVKKAKKNIRRMAKKANAEGIRFRPHFKTHQSREIGEWFKEVGVSGITVSSLAMAWHFQKGGWKDITIAIPCNPLQAPELDRLAGLCQLNILIEAQPVVEKLARTLTQQVGIWIEIDVGDFRTGVSWENRKILSQLYEAIQNVQHFSFMGLLTHAGQTYHASTPEEILDIHEKSVSRMNNVKRQLEAIRSSEVEISIGDTPSLSLVTDLGSIDEIRPGSFVFYDLTQVWLGAAREEDIAIGVACPVIAKYPERNEIVVHGGAVHLSKETLPLSDGIQMFGKVTTLSTDSWGPSMEDVYVSNLSQEHGVIKAPREFIESTNYGDILVILPVHSCLTANLFSTFQSLDGEVFPSFHL